LCSTNKIDDRVMAGRRRGCERLLMPFPRRLRKTTDFKDVGIAVRRRVTMKAFGQDHLEGDQARLPRSTADAPQYWSLSSRDGFAGFRGSKLPPTPLI